MLVLLDLFQARTIFYNPKETWLQKVKKKLCLVVVANVVRDQIALSGSIVFRLWAVPTQLANCSTFLALDRSHLKVFKIDKLYSFSKCISRPNVFGYHERSFRLREQEEAMLEHTTCQGDFIILLLIPNI